MRFVFQRILIFLYCFSNAIVYGQISDPNNPTYLNVVGPSPNVSALNKYSETPVNAYTGIPNIQIPIYTVKEKDLTLPIYLSYHSGGIRVNEESSRVGLGWALQAGGEISRSIRGGDDFYPQYGYLNNPMPESINNFYSVRNYNNCLYPTPYCQVSGENFSDVDIENVVNDGSPNNTLDLEPDDYTYNIGEFSGKFIIRKNKTIILSKPDGVEITLTDATYNNCKWQIRKPDGTVLLFEQKENSASLIPLQHGSATIGGTTVWYLTKIVTPLGVTINFSYSTSQSGYLSEITQMSESQGVQSLSSEINGTTCAVQGNVKIPSTPTTHDLVTLTAINFDYGQINFSYSNRVDVSNDKKLDSISIQNLANSSQNISYYFNYDYFIANDNLGKGYSQGTAGDLINKRLKLISLQEKTSNNTASFPPYQFQYNETYLPQKDNYARDAWGYYNGVYSNTTLLPTLVYGVINTSSNALTFNTFIGADRSTNVNFSQAFILKQIKYPTGGITNFDYESNDYDIGNSINSNYIGSNYQVGLTQHPSNNTFLRGNADKTIYFDMRNEVSDGKNLYITLTAGYGNPNYTSTDASLAYLKVFQKGSSTPLYTYLLGRNDSWTSYGGGAYGYTCTANLPPGEYNLVLHVDNSLLFLQQINIATNWLEDENILSNHTIKAGGGIRIKRITDIPDALNSSNQIVKRFEYHSFEDRNGDGTNEEYSFGRRMSPLQFFTIDYRGIGQLVNDVVTCNTCNDLIIYSNSLNIVNSIGYDTVVEYYGENGENGKTQYVYNNSPDQVLIYTPNGSQHAVNSAVLSFHDINISNRSAGMQNFANVQNGDLLAQTDFQFDQTSGQFRKVRDVSNSYILNTINTQAVFGYKPSEDNYDRNRVGPDNCFNISPCYFHLMQYPVLQASFDELVSRVEKTYDQTNQQTYVEERTDYLYEQTNPIHYQPIRTTTYRSNGNKKNQFFIYPSDYPSGTAFIDNMVNNHVINVPIETVIEQVDVNNNSAILDGTVVEYSSSGVSLPISKLNIETSSPTALSNFKFSNRSIGVLPSSGTSSSFQVDPSYITKILFDTYDIHNNLLQQHKVNNVNKSYIWDYKNNYPIAEITNAIQANVAYTSFEADGTGNWAVNNGSLVTTGGMTGSNSYMLGGTNSITSSTLPTGNYTLTYWSKNGSSSATVNGSLGTAVTTKNGWTLYSHTLTGITSVTISGTVTIDELRLYPTNAQMTTYTYTPLIGMTSQCDAANHITYYEYDGLGRLKLIRNQDNYIIKQYDYQYQAAPGN